MVPCAHVYVFDFCPVGGEWSLGKINPVKNHTEPSALRYHYGNIT